MKIIAIVGPTASGKTDISLKLAKKIGGEIINADSMLFYKDFSVGTDKPKKDKFKKSYYVNGVRHYLIDFLSPKKSYSIDSFIKESKKIIDNILIQNKIPIIVGGSALYTNAILYNYELSGISSDEKLRKTLSLKSLGDLLAMLKNISKKSYEIVDKKNKRRVIRAIEISMNGKDISRSRNDLSKDILLLGVLKNKEALHNNIDKRVQIMIKNGLILEVKKLLKKYPKKSPAFLGIGYREVLSYLNNEISFEEMIDKIKIDTRRLAKKQMTWYKKDKNIIWISSFKQALLKSSKFIS